MWPNKDIKCNFTKGRCNKPLSPNVSNVETKVASSCTSHSLLPREEAGQSRHIFPEHLLGAGICTLAIPFDLCLDSEE